MYMKMHYAFSIIFIPIYQICIYSQIYNHTTCNSTISTITQICSLEQFTISSPMAYTHNYIPYNCDIMFTHQAYALTYLFPLNSSHSIQQFHTHNTWAFFVQFTQKYSCHYSHHYLHHYSHPRFKDFETDINSHFRPHSHQNMI